MKRTLARLPAMVAVALGLLATTSLGSAQAQGTTSKPSTGTRKGDAKPQPPKWPELTRQQKDTGEKWLALLVSPKEEIVAKAKDQLEAVGLGFGDRLLRSVKDSKYNNVNGHLFEVLDRIVKPEHAALLGLHAKHKSIAARRYVLKRLFVFGRPDSAGVFRTARKDKDIEVAYYAALGLVKTTRDLDALEAVFQRCSKDGMWEELGDEVTRNLRQTRSDVYLPWIRKHLAKDDTIAQATTLRFMRAIAPAQAKTMVRPFLDSQHNILKKEAINTLRVIVDGKDPLPPEKITVFMVISMAKEWKKRI